MTTYIDFRVLAEESLSTFPKSNLYFLLDHGGLPGLRQQLSRSSTTWVSLFDGAKEAGALDASPILILIGSNGSINLTRSVLEWIGRNGTYTSTVILLSSPLSLNSMRTRLKARLDVRLSEEIDAMLRFFDPRVLETLGKILSSAQFLEFFNVAERWQYADRTGVVRTINSDFASGDDFFSPLILTQQQEFDLIDASEIDQVLDLLRTNVHIFMEKLPPYKQYEFVRQTVELARKDGLDSTLKYTLYTTVLLLNGSQFIRNPAWENFLGKLKNNDINCLENFVAMNGL